jgi:hypothetical protein
MLGSDGRYYLLDLFRTTPVDYNYSSHNPAATANGRKLRHDLAVHRYELLSFYAKYKQVRHTAERQRDRETQKERKRGRERCRRNREQPQAAPRPGCAPL